MAEKMTDVELGAAVRRLFAVDGFVSFLAAWSKDCGSFFAVQYDVPHDRLYYEGATLDDAIRAALAAVEDHDDAD